MTNPTTSVDLATGEVVEDRPQLFDKPHELMESPEIDKLMPALIDAQADIEPIIKEASNPAFRSRYATLTAYLAALRAPLAKHRLLLTGQTVVGSNGKHRLLTRVVHESGQWLGSWWELSPTKADPQGEGSALTYARRYQIGVVLQVAAEEDDDGNAAAGNAAGQQERPRRAARPAAGVDWLKAGQAIAADGKLEPTERRIELLKLIEACERANQSTPALNRALVEIGKTIKAAIDAQPTVAAAQ